MPKTRIISKNASNKSSWALNFLQKSQYMNMSISFRSGARGHRRSPYMKYYNVVPWENRFPLGLNSAKNTDYIKMFMFLKTFSILPKIILRFVWFFFKISSMLPHNFSIIIIITPTFPQNFPKSQRSLKNKIICSFLINFQNANF